MRYTITELNRLENLVEKAVIEAAGNMEQMEGHPWRALVELNHDNMVSLREKIQKDIEQHRNRLAR